MSSQADPKAHWLEYSPRWAPYVVGRHEPISFDDGDRREQRWEVECKHCGATFQGTCATGLVRRHVANFAHQHFECKPRRIDPT
jgi:hypothetical protein